MAYNGYLLAFGSVVLSNAYLTQGSYSVTPSQRTELAAYRDNSNNLHRTTSSNYKTKITFSTKPLTLDEKIALQNVIASGMVNNTERKVQVTYYNDETNSYYTGYFYITDVTYTVLDTFGNDIIYNPISYTLIEY